MKILLIEPAKAPISLAGEDVYIFEPLALEYIAAGVVKDHDVRIIDLRLDNNLQEELEYFSPDIVGITAYTVHVNTVRNLFDRIKKWNSQILTLVGGHHATVAPEDFNQPSIDLIVLGEGVSTFKQIVERHEKGNDFDGIPGIAYTKKNEYIRSDYSKIFDLDALPFPERKLTSKYRRHYYSEWMKPLASIRTSKGCPYRCNFCALWKLTGGKYFKRKPEKIIEELKTIDEEFVFFADDESLVDVERMKTLAALIKNEGIKKRYFLYGRSDTIKNNPELLKMWKDVGLERVFVGLEFFNDDDLNYIRKSSRTDDNEKAIKLLHDLDIDEYASFI
ncbi:B12-binding domain-containing radical SAM protein, partial [Bacteroidota bacterium]